jgi:hypothetical protein
MNKAKGMTFSGRGLVSVATTLGFMALVITGVVLYVTPPGRFANWTGWRLLGLTKDQWGALHMCFGAGFLVAAGFHIYLNWRPLLNYFKSRLTRRFALRGDWVLALVLFGVVWIATLAEVPPFSYLVALNETIKNSWEEEDARPPIPHAELLTLAELAAEVSADPHAMIARLRAKGIAVESPAIVVADLAQAHGLTPRELHDIAVGPVAREHGPGGGAGRGGGGMGRKTLARYCVDAGRDLGLVLERLRDVGIEAGADMTLREIAEVNDMRPFDLAEILEAGP